MENKKSMGFLSIALTILVLIAIALSVYFFVLKIDDSKTVNKNSDQTELSSEDIKKKEAIIAYLISKDKPSVSSGKCFANIQKYDSKKQDDNIVYAQVYSQCFSLGNNEINRLNGYSIPAKITLNLDSEKYSVTKFEEPKGTYNSIFPSDVSVKLVKAQEDGTVKTLADSLDKQAKEFFGDLNVITR